jgi:hypothetical protein
MMMEKIGLTPNGQRETRLNGTGVALINFEGATDALRPFWTRLVSRPNESDCCGLEMCHCHGR